LNALLIDRVKFGNWLALLISLVFLAGVIFMAYSSRADDLRDDYVEVVEPVPLGDNIVGVNVDVQSVDTTVIFRPYTLEETDNPRSVGAKFTGSKESRVTITIEQDDQNRLNLTVVETRPNSIPNLEDMGRGQLEVYLPVGVTIDNLNFENQNGPVTFDFRQVDVPRFNIVNRSGDIDLYMPLEGIVIGDVTIDEGNLLVVIPPDISLRVSGTQGSRELDTNVYLPIEGGDIESRGGLSEFQVILRANVPDGTLSIRPQ
jgi:hypothetical protein